MAAGLGVRQLLFIWQRLRNALLAAAMNVQKKP